MPQSIVSHFKDTKTKLGHEIKIDHEESFSLIWVLKWLDQEPSIHSHIGIAKIEKDGNGYKVG